MHRRYDIATKEAPPARTVPNKFRPAVNRLKLARMLVREAFHYRFDRDLLLSRPCIYGVFSGPVGGFWPIRGKCVGCMRCVQEYPDMCRVLLDEDYRRLGDSYFEPDSVAALNFEATTGKIMVKGVGYKGPFSGSGFDSMWTDMSEIVRPTRDGIYGREYISTAVDVGRKPRRLEAGPALPILELPLPVVFNAAAPGARAPGVQEAIFAAASRLGTLFFSDIPPSNPAWTAAWVPRAGSAAGQAVAGARMVELEAGADPGARGSIIVCARLALDEEALPKILELYRRGLGVFHVTANYHGRCGEGGRSFIKDVLLGLHRALVREGVRDEVTLIASGGIVRAEHVPKALLCGADLVALDTPVLAALHAEFLGEHAGPESANLRVPPCDPEWGAQRIVNFCASWRNQLLEIASAMGIRDVRRMRGETGRAIFYEDLEKEWLKR